MRCLPPSTTLGEDIVSPAVMTECMMKVTIRYPTKTRPGIAISIGALLLSCI